MYIKTYTHMYTFTDIYIYAHTSNTYLHTQTVTHTSINTLYDLYNQYITYIYLPKSQEIMNVHSAMHV